MVNNQVGWPAGSWQFIRPGTVHPTDECATLRIGSGVFTCSYAGAWADDTFSGVTFQYASETGSLLLIALGGLAVLRRNKHPRVGPRERNTPSITSVGPDRRAGRFFFFVAMAATGK